MLNYDFVNRYVKNQIKDYFRNNGYELLESERYVNMYESYGASDRELGYCEDNENYVSDYDIDNYEDYKIQELEKGEDY